MIKDTAEKLSQVHFYVQLMGFHSLLSPLQSPVSSSGSGFSPPTPFSFFLDLTLLSCSSSPAFRLLSLTLLPTFYLFITQLNFFLLLFSLTPPKSCFPQTNAALQQSKWGWNCCLYSSEHVKKVRMWRFHTIYLKGKYILSDQDKTAK